jgi:pimeloyl-ACP methyl ester carboxylesterase
MDRRGRGGSGVAPNYDIVREAEDVAAVVDAIGESVFVVGHSYGAICSLEAALLTDNIGRLVLYEPPIPAGIPFIAPDVPAQMQALIDEGDLEEALVLFFREGPKMPEHELKAYRQLPMWSTRVELVPTVAREMAVDHTYQFHAEKFAHLQVPTLLLVGSDSPQIFYKAIELADAALPNSKVVVLPDQQLIAMDTAPEMFVDKVVDFLLA